MIIASLGKLCVAQALTATTQISDNVIQLPTIDYAALTDVWLVIDTVVVAGGSGTLLFDLVMDTQVALDGTQVSVNRTYLAAETDLRVTTLGRHICAVNVGKMLKEMLETSGSDYPFIGLVMILSSSATVTVDASLSPTEPHTIHHKMQTESNVGIPTIASDDSGSSV